MWEEILNLAINNGLWAVLFMGLLIYQLKDSKNRENKYQETIIELNKTLNKVNKIDENVNELSENISDVKQNIIRIESSVTKLIDHKKGRVKDEKDDRILD